MNQPVIYKNGKFLKREMDSDNLAEPVGCVNYKYTKTSFLHWLNHKLQKGWFNYLYFCATLSKRS